MDKAPIWWRLSYPPVNHVWFPGAWRIWWPTYRHYISRRNAVRRWWWGKTYTSRKKKQEETLREWHRKDAQKRINKLYILRQNIRPLVEARGKARQDKDWEAADKYRDAILLLDVRIHDSEEGSAYYQHGVTIDYYKSL